METMKDYRNQIRSIILANFRISAGSDTGKKDIAGIPGMSSAIDQLNRLMQNEVSGLESEIVSLTDQMIEYDSLFSGVRRKANRPSTYYDTGKKGARIHHKAGSA